MWNIKFHWDLLPFPAPVALGVQSSRSSGVGAYADHEAPLAPHFFSTVCFETDVSLTGKIRRRRTHGQILGFPKTSGTL